MKISRLKPYSVLAGFLCILLTSMWASYTPFPSVMRVSDAMYPNEYAPAIAAPGENFTIFVDVERIWVGDLEVQVDHGNVILPSSLAAGWYDLTLLISGVNTTRQSSLYVAPDGSRDFTFVQMTDMHTPAFWGLDVEERRQFADLINDLGPTFVVDTGDMTDYGLEEQYVFYDWIISGLDMPLYTAPGNQETYSDPNLERYAHHLGPGNYFFYFGDILFVAGAPLHSPRAWGGFDDAQIRWVNETLSKEATLKFFINHIPIVAQEGRDYSLVPWAWKGDHFSMIDQGHDQIVEILTRENAVNLVGHWHGYQAKFEYRGATFYNTPSVTRNLGTSIGPCFRLFRIVNNTIVFDKVIEFSEIDIQHTYSTDNTRANVTIVNNAGFSTPMNIHLRLSPTGYPYSASLGDVIYADPSGDTWVRYDAPLGTSQIKVYP